MRILVLGKNGQLGWELLRTLATLGCVVGLDLPEINLAHPDQIRRKILDIQPLVIFNAAAYTQVDRAESEPELAMAVNGVAPGVIAETAAQIGAAFIHFSTDYVFDGKKGAPYEENDTPNPLNTYGATKLAGENAVWGSTAACLVFRTSWVYSMRGDNFVSKVLEWARQNRNLRMVTDQIGNPTWARMLAEAAAQILAMSIPDPVGFMQQRTGIYHLAGSGIASRFEWAQEILKLDPHKQEQLCTELQPAQTSEFPTPAARPLFSALNCDLFVNTFGFHLPDWRQALELAMGSC